MEIIRLRDLEPSELQRLRELCNFTKDEKTYFNLRSKDYSNVQIALVLHVSEAQVSKLAKRVKSKILRVI